MDDKKWTAKHENHFDLGDLGMVAIFIFMGLATGTYLLWRGIEAGNTLAILIAWTLVVLGLLSIGVGATLLIMRQVVKAEVRRSLVEQDRWRDNAQENMAVMASMQKVQNLQNSQLLKQAREAQRALPAPDGDVIDAGFQFDESLFDEIEMEN